MGPALNLLRRPPQYCGNYGSYVDDCDQQEHEQAPGGLIMADKATRSVDGDEEEDAKRTSSKVVDRDHEGWLQLGTGSGHRSNSNSNPQVDPSTFMDPSTSYNSRDDHKGTDLVELSLLCRRPATADPWPTTEPPQLQLPPLAGFPTFTPLFPAVLGGYPISPSSIVRTLTPATPVPSSCRRGRLLCPPESLSSSTWRLEGDLRVVGLPRRAQTGLWLVLQAAQEQVKEPLILPQIPKSYLRIKDGRMTIRLLMKYLANKLGLDDESEVEITCKGQQLPPFLTLIYVRDNIWCSPESAELNSGLSCTKYVMTLIYSRSRK